VKLQYRATVFSPQFVVVCRGWWFIKGGSKLKYYIVQNFYPQSFMVLSKDDAVSWADYT